MDFGKLASVDQVDFSFIPDPPQNKNVLDDFSVRPVAPRIYLGATGYNMKPWVGIWYPAGAREAAFLRCYGQQFNTIEHNTTHYRIPDHATVRRWRDEVPDDFRFCPKIPQAISHVRQLGVQNGEIRAFCDAISLLEHKMGCCFMQLPPQFSVQQLPLLEHFLSVFPVSAIPLAIEVRHPSFFQNSPAAATYYSILREYGAPAVITDVAGRRDVCHMRLTQGRVLIRFVGNGLHPTDSSRVKQWAARLTHWFALGLREAYFFCHEPDNLLAPELAALAASVFSTALPEAILRGPAPLEPPGRQGSLF
ncbi:MAG: DUF72 domain-containing protein [Saprospirales bacterium]|nr:DUF72 domain-containing protein [Saprospirales bacterium]MBK8920183.1 DUF72 domain-containing protein [Saprospirales bacterium]